MTERILLVEWLRRHNIPRNTVYSWLRLGQMPVPAERDERNRWWVIVDAEADHKWVYDPKANATNVAGPQHSRYRHGASSGGKLSPTYISWRGMFPRCYNPKASQYVYYGAKGIKVADRWRDYANFLSDMGERPEGMTLDRIDVNGDYAPGNCRWADGKTQSRNRRDRKYYTHNGQTLLLSDWATTLGVPLHTLQTRLRAGWPFEKVFTSGKFKPGLRPNNM